MPSTYSPLLRLELMATGEKSATWGDITNTNLGTLIEKGIAGSATINVTAGNVTLTALNGADDEARCLTLLITGTPGVSRNVVAPSASKTYCVINGSNAAVVVKGAATSGVSLAAGERSWVAWNGSDFVRIGVATDSPTFTGTTSLTTVALAAGSVGSPSYTFSGDTNNGWWSPAADVQAWSVSGGEQMRLQSVGLGVGMTPVYRVDATGGNGNGFRYNGPSAQTLLGELDSTGYVGTLTNHSLRLFTNNTARVTVDSSGRVSIGGTPSTGWASGRRPLQIQSFVSVWEQSNGAANLGFGLYEGGTNTFNYLTTGDAPTLYSQVSGRHIWYGAASGSAGGAVSLSQRMELNATGDLLVPARVAIGGGASLFGGVPLNVRVGTNQNLSVLTATLGGTPMSTVAGLTDAGVSTNLLVTGSSLRFSGNGGSNEHMAIATGGNVTINAPSSGYPLQASANGTLAALFRNTNAGSVNAGIAFGSPGSTELSAGVAGLAITGTSGELLLQYVTGGALTEGLRLTVAGQLRAPAIHNNASGASGTTPMLASGTYTPTITQGINCSGGTPAVNGTFKWYRVGNAVHLSGWLSSTGGFTASNTYTELILSLPVASAFTLQSDATGMCAFSNSANNAGQGDYVYADTGGDRLIATFYPNSTSGAFLFVEATYEVK